MPACPLDGQRGPHYLSALRPASAPDELPARLKADNIHVSRRGDRLRVSPHLYTSDSAITRFLKVLKHHLG